MADLENRIASFSPAKRALLERRRRKFPRTAPVSSAQRRLWLFQQLDPTSGAYNVRLTLHLTGALDHRALDMAMTEIARRHDILRTTFPAEEGAPTQYVRAPGRVQAPLLDLRTHPRPEAAARHLIDVETRRPFTLAEDAIIRPLLMRLGEHEHVLLLVTHHVACDGWSLGLLSREFVTLYRAYVAGKPSPLPELPIQYADYARWEQSSLHGEALDQQLRYWRQQLSGATILQLPTDFARPATVSTRGGRVMVSCPADVRDALHALGRAHGATPFMTLLAAYQVLLARYSGQQDIPVGTAIAGRTRVETESLLGCFINTLVLRSQVRPHLRFSELLTHVRETVLDAYAHQDVPFEAILEDIADDLAPTRKFAPHTPFHRATFVMHNTPRAEAVDLPGLRITDFDGGHDTAKRELALGIVETRDGLAGSFAYASDLFRHDTIERLARQFERLLRAISLDPEQPISRLPLLDDGERQQLCVTWNDTARPAPHAGCIHELFAAQAARRPDAIALTFEEQQLTFGELQRRAQQVAGSLRRTGIGADTCVAICLDRGFDLVIAVLGTLGAGATYLALDPAFPPERLSHIVTQSQAPVLITQSEIHDRLTLLPWVQTIKVGAEWPAIAREPATAGVPDVYADNLAYVEYTSGSTGRPKGVAVTHAGAANLAHTFIDAFDITPTSAVLQFFSWSFDGAVAEWMMTLLAGARLVLGRRETMASGLDLMRLLTEEQVEVAILPPSLLGVLEGEAPTLRTLISAGEACTEAIAARWAPGRRLLNAYGPTECSVCVSISDPATGTEVPPIGRPMANVRVYVLDDEGDLAPVGVAGELYVGGAGVARGYLHAPGQTADRFVPDPFSAIPGARLYRTGDLVRWRADGHLLFLGRQDQQIKVRGFRVEPAEIERVLNQHPQVQHVIVDMRNDPTRRPRLVAYVVPHGAAQTGDQRPLVQDLQELATRHLPEYMVPSAIVLLDRLPLTPSGKVDRQALPAPGQDTVDAPRTEPRTPAERTLAAIWRQVLRVDHVSADDNFFDLGGDSILSIQVVARAMDAGLQLAPRDVFQHQTLAALATAASPASGEAAGDAEAGAPTRPIPLTPIQHWLFEQELAAPHRYFQAVMLQGRERLDRGHLAASVRAIVGHHDALRMQFVAPTPQQPHWHQRQTSDAPASVFLSIDLSALDPQVARLMLDRVVTRLNDSLDLTQGPLLRIAHFDLGPDQSERLFLVVHHLVIDGVSWRILLQDLATVYGQVRRREPIALPRKTTSFGRWAEALAGAAASDRWTAERDYWLAPTEPGVPLPRDADGPNTMGSARTVGVELGAEYSLALVRELPRLTGAHVDEILLTALLDAMGRWAGAPALAIALEGHGREDVGSGLDVSRTIGWFTTVCPVILPRLPSGNLLQQLDAVKMRLRAVPHRGIGYGLLRYLSPDEHIRHALRARPTADIGFNYLGQFDQLFESDSAWVPVTDVARRVQHDPSPRVHTLEIVASIRKERLYASFGYSHHLHREETIARLADEFLRTLERLIDESRLLPAAPPTPADFPLAQLTGEQLTAVLQQLGGGTRPDSSAG